MQIGHKSKFYFTQLAGYLRTFPVYLIKAPILLKNLYVYWLMPLMGFFYLAKERKILKATIPFFLLYALSMVYSVIISDWLMLKRSVQLFFMLGYMHYIFTYFKKEDYLKLTVGAILIYIVVFYYQYKIIGFGAKIIGPWRIYCRFDGPTGFGNHSAFAMAILLVISFLENKKKLTIGCFFCLLPMVSFSAFLFIFVTVGLIYGFSKCRKETQRKCCHTLFWLLFLYPVLIYAFEKTIPISIAKILNQASNTRFALQLSYLEIFKDYPFGVGLGNGPLMLPPYLKAGSELVRGGHFIFAYTEMDSHNLWMNALIDFGFIGYGILFLFIYNLLKLGFKSEQYLPLMGFLCTCWGYLSLDGIYDMGLYIVMSYFLMKVSSVINLDYLDLNFSNIYSGLMLKKRDFK